MAELDKRLEATLKTSRAKLNAAEKRYKKLKSDFDSLQRQQNTARNELKREEALLRQAAQRQGIDSEAYRSRRSQYEFVKNKLDTLLTQSPNLATDLSAAKLEVDTLVADIKEAQEGAEAAVAVRKRQEDVRRQIQDQVERLTAQATGLRNTAALERDLGNEAEALRLEAQAEEVQSRAVALSAPAGISTPQQATPVVPKTDAAVLLPGETATGAPAPAAPTAPTARPTGPSAVTGAPVQTRPAAAAAAGAATPTPTAGAQTPTAGTKTPTGKGKGQKDAVVPPTGSAEGMREAAAYGLTKDLIARYPELQAVYDLYFKGDITEARLRYQQTSFSRNLTKTAQERQVKQVNQPGAYAQELEAFKIEQKRSLAAKGVTIDDAELEQAYLSGLSTEQIELKALAKFGGRIGGETGASVEALKTYANSFGVGYPQATIDQWSKDIFAGQLTTFDVQQRIRQDAASAFPAYADQIDKGISMDAIASAYKSSMANILERDPDSITFNDLRLRQALQYTVDGKPAVKPLWQFEKELRSTPEWEYTNNARDTIDSLSMKVLREWGLA